MQRQIVMMGILNVLAFVAPSVHATEVQHYSSLDPSIGPEGCASVNLVPPQVNPDPGCIEPAGTQFVASMDRAETAVPSAAPE